jgi:glycosyltransferase involved in cell wall biosynthesis
VYERDEGGVAYHVVPGNRRHRGRLLQAFGALATRRRCDAVVYRPFGGWNWPNAAGIAAFRSMAALRRVPFVLSLWSGPVQTLRVPWAFTGIVLAAPQVGSRGRVFTVPPVVTVPPGAVTEPERRARRAALGFADGECVCLFTYCARVDDPGLWEYALEARGLRDLLRAAALIGGSVPVRFVVSMPMLAEVGPRRYLGDLLAEHGVQDRFTLMEGIDDLVGFLRLVDVYAYPLRVDEPSWAPVSVLEALALGLPVVTTSTSSVAAYVSEREAWVYPAGEPAGLAARLEQLLIAPEDARERALRGRELVLSRYGAGPAGQAFLAAVQRMVSAA